MTSTLQQEASRKLRFSAQHTMRVAQRLYENGYITYMRTDSTSLSETAIAAARDQAGSSTAPTPSRPSRASTTGRSRTRRRPTRRSARPATASAPPTRCAASSPGEEAALYDLVWKRTVASQMADARGETVSVRIGATAADGRDAEFGTAGTVITFRGFMLAYEEGRDEAVAADEEERRLPPLAEGDKLDATALEPDGHSTTPPARYTEATLVRALEERGIGRPSTYASILGTILDRGYVRKVGQALVPSFLAFSVTNLLEQHFTKLVDYEFTALMEDDLDRIAAGDEERTAWLRRFYFGERLGPRRRWPEGARLRPRRHRRPRDQHDRDRQRDRAARRPLRPLHRAERPAADDLRRHRARRADGRAGRGAALPGLGAARARHRPVDRPHDRRQERPLRPLRDRGRREGDGEKPRTASLFKSMSPETVTLEEALRLLSLPRVVGVDPADGEEIVASNGRYGPFIKKGSDTSSLETEEQLLTLTLEEALAVLAQPKQRGRRAEAAAPLRELGPDPVSGKQMVVKNGRFGPYVTDGETNASLRASDDVETLTDERAAELMAARRERGPAKPRSRRK